MLQTSVRSPGSFVTYLMQQISEYSLQGSARVTTNAASERSLPC